MKWFEFKLTVWIFFLFTGFVQSGEIEVNRLGSNIIVLNEKSAMGIGNITAVSTDKGIVVVDTHISPEVMKRMKAEIEKEFNRSDYCYIINTHEHLEHLAGNVLFPDVTIIGHDSLEAGARRQVPESIKYLENNIAWNEAELKKLDADSKEARELRENTKYRKAHVRFLQNEFKLVPPHITFSRRLTLDCGSHKIKLVYFGKGHTNSDVIVYIPKEGTAVSGGAFKYTVPPKMYPNPENDYQRWIAVLSELLDEKNKLEYIVPGHYNIMTREELQFVHDYLEEIWFGILRSKSNGAVFDEVKNEFSLQKRFSGFKQFEEQTDYMQDRHQKNIKIVWECLNKK